MRHLFFALLASILLLNCHSAQALKKTCGFKVYNPPGNWQQQSAYQPVFESCKNKVEAFFGKPFPRHFTINIYPSRLLLDASWQQAWKMPEFHSECWMVASGVAEQLDLLSPTVWSTAACEHRWEDQTASERLIAHEMTHVYHGQHNESPDFSATSGLDWFVEGLAVYASGQCDSLRMADLRQWLDSHAMPHSLDEFWTGPQKYGLSGSAVRFLDQKLGREKLGSLLGYAKKEDLLQAIGMSEAAFLSAWEKSLKIP